MVVLNVNKKNGEFIENGGKRVGVAVEISTAGVPHPGWGETLRRQNFVRGKLRIEVML